MEQTETFKPYVNAGIVVRMKVQDVGRLEQFVQGIYGAQLIFLEKCPKTVKLRIVKESGGIKEDDSREDFV